MTVLSRAHEQATGATNIKHIVKVNYWYQLYEIGCKVQFFFRHPLRKARSR